MGMSSQTKHSPAPKAADPATVPPGYKQTEVGVIPEDWEICTLDNLGSFMKGRGIKRDDVVDDGIACIRYGEIYTRYHNHVQNLRSHIPKSVAQTSQRIKTGDLLFAGSGETAEEIGKCVAYLGKNEAYAGGDIVILRCTEQNSLYLGYLLSHPLITQQKTRLAQGDAVVHISARNLGMVKLPLPPLPEQRAIAEALSDADGLIESLAKLIAKKRAIKHATMQQLLTGQTRLPGFEGKWETKRLGDVANIKTGSRNNQDKVADGQYPFFVRSQEVEYIDTYSYDCEAIVVPGEGNIGNIFHYIVGKFELHQRVYKISDFPERVCGRFVFYMMVQSFGKHAMRNTVKATVDSLRLPTFCNFTFMSPPDYSEQAAIAAVLSDMDAEIEALEQRLEKTRQIKQGMMQELLTGRVRLIENG